SLKNTEKKSDHLLKLANSNYDEVELYSFSEKMVLEDSVLISKKGAFYDRQYADINYLFDLNIPPGAVKNFYVRIKSKMPLIVPMYVLLPHQHINIAANEYSLSGIFIGIVLIMSVYNLFLYISIRDTSYLYYVCYVVGAGITQMGIRGINFQF